MWLFRHKYLADGTLSRYKARLVASGSTQLDVKNAFLHGDLSEIVYKHQPSGFRDSAHPDYVYLGAINYFLCISVTRDSFEMFLSQRKYAIEIHETAYMVNCNPSRSTVDTESKLGNDGDLVDDSTLYRSLTSSLQYLTFTRPDISYAVQQGTLEYGLQLFVSSTTSLVAYSDVDWVSCPTSGYCVFLGNNLLSWSFKLLSRSSVEAEYRGVANVVAETCWLRNLLRELHTPLSSATLVYCDNVRVLHVLSRYQYADIFTK
ncbi:ribonuclease H-like domain-containing protein [Tanacetum coccineum]